MIFFIIALLCTYSFSLGAPTDRSLKRLRPWEDSLGTQTTPPPLQRQRTGTPVGAHTTPTPPANGIDQFGSNMSPGSPVTPQTPVLQQSGTTPTSDQEFDELAAPGEVLEEAGVPTSPSHGSPSTTPTSETGTPPPHNPRRISGPTQLPAQRVVRHLVFDSE